MPNILVLDGLLDTIFKPDRLFEEHEPEIDLISS